MKKTLTVLLSGILATGALAVTASAEASAEVYVSVADENGKLAMAREKVTVTDINGDGAFDIDEALSAAHEASYNGEDGYEAYDGDYGRAIKKLWGVDNGGSYGYYVNNASAMSLNDTVKDGDHVYAYLYTDLTAWSDTYSFFDADTAKAEQGEKLTLTLSAAGYDESFAPITLPVEGAVITFNGEATEYVTDSEGKVEISVSDTGSVVISAVSDTMTLVPPVCIAEISEKEASSDTEAEVSKNNPDTGVESVAVFGGLAMVAACAVYCARNSMRKNEK